MKKIDFQFFHFFLENNEENEIECDDDDNGNQEKQPSYWTMKKFVVVLNDFLYTNNR